MSFQFRLWSLEICTLPQCLRMVLLLLNLVDVVMVIMIYMIIFQDFIQFENYEKSLKEEGDNNNGKIKYKLIINNYKSN